MQHKSTQKILLFSVAAQKVEKIKALIEGLYCCSCCSYCSATKL